MGLFVRLTVLVALVFLVLFILAFVVKVLFVAAIVAALILLALGIASRFRRHRDGAAVMTIDARR